MGPEQHRPPRHISSPALALVALSLLTLAVHARALGGGFVYDDSWTIVHNSAIRSFARLPELVDGTAVAQRVPDAWRPLMVISQMLDYQLFGLAPAGHHAHSLLWHLAVVLLLYAFARRLTRDPSLALVAAALFAVHPLHVEPVAAINYREDLLAACFTLSALTLTLAPPSAERGTPFRRLGWPAVLAALLALVGLLAKATAAVAPLAYLALRLVGDEGPFWRRLRRGLPTAAVLASAVALFLLWRLLTSGAIDPYGASGSRLALAGTERLAHWPTFAVAFARMALQLLVPVGLAPEYTVPLHSWSSPAGWGAIALLVALGLLGAYCSRRRLHAPAAGAALLLVCWLPTCGVLPLPNVQADRYAYLPSVGACLLAAWLLRLLPRPGARAVVSCCAVAVLAALAVHQQRIWRDELSLWRAATERAPASARAWTGLARAHAAERQLGAAERAIARATVLAPRSGDAQLVRANILARQRRFRAAAASYHLAERRGVRHPAQLFTSWGWAAHLAGDSRRALALLRRAVRVDPRLAQAHANLGRVLAARGDYRAARASLRRAVDLAPERASFRQALRALPTGG